LGEDQAAEPEDGDEEEGWIKHCSQSHGTENFSKVPPGRQGAKSRASWGGARFALALEFEPD
jgi:hypothetical protein